MATGTVRISGSDGSELRAVAREVAALLELPVVDDELVLRAAYEAGVGPEVVADVERRRSFLHRAVGADAAGR